MKFTNGDPIPHYHLYNEDIGFLDRLLINQRRQFEGVNQRMFDEDFARIFNVSINREASVFEVKSSHDELVNRLLENVRSRYQRHSADKTIRQMVEDIARSLLGSGVAYYSVQDDIAKDEIYITPISASGVFNIGKMYFQFLPKRNERLWDLSNQVLGRELRLLDRKKLMRFRLPRGLRSILIYQESLLAALDKSEPTSMNYFPKATYENPNPRNDFDFRVWNEVRDSAFYRATSKTGWNGRRQDSEKRSGFFNCYRLIRFRKKQVFLRDRVLEQLSNELTRVGQRYQADFSICIFPKKILLSLSDLQELEVRLMREEVSFSEVIDFCYQR